MTTDLRLVSDLLSKVLDFFRSAPLALRDGRGEDAATAFRAAALLCSPNHQYPLHPVMQAADADLARVAEGDVCLPIRGGGEPHHFVSAHHAVWLMCELCWLWESASSPPNPYPFDLGPGSLSRLTTHLARERAKLFRDRAVSRTLEGEATPWEMGEWAKPKTQVAQALTVMLRNESGVDKEVFASEVWSGIDVSDGTLRTAVSRVNKYLEEQGSTRKISSENGRIVWVE